MTDVLSDIHAKIQLATTTAEKGNIQSTVVYLYDAIVLAKNNNMENLAKQIEELIDFYIQMQVYGHPKN